MVFMKQLRDAFFRISSHQLSARQNIPGILIYAQTHSHVQEADKDALYLVSCAS